MGCRDSEERVCGTCTHHEPPSWHDGETEWLCGNEIADAFGLPTEYNDSCSDWEGTDK